jgi:integrase
VPGLFRESTGNHVRVFSGSEFLFVSLAVPIMNWDASMIDQRHDAITNLKTMLTFAQRRGLVAQNVARGVRIKADDREADHGLVRAGVDFPSMSELNLLIDSAAPRWRPFIVTAIFTGMRMSELRGLRWSDVDLDAGIIHVRQRADDWGTMGPPKSRAGKRDIPLEAGEHRYNFHLLRHAAASLFIAHLKWPPKRIQTVMGHDPLWPPISKRRGRP